MSDRSCAHCGGEVERRGTRGRWPKLCRTCHDSPDVQRATRRRLHDEEVTRVQQRIDRLMERLERLRSKEDA